jgi:HSP20 family protein
MKLGNGLRWLPALAAVNIRAAGARQARCLQVRIRPKQRSAIGPMCDPRRAEMMDVPLQKGGDDMPAIVKWSPFRELDWMDPGMRRIFDDFALTPGLLPAADVYETKDEFVVELEVPGFEQRELAIEVTDHTLVVKGERTEANEDEKDRQFRLRERLEQAFERRFYLPSDSDTERVKAEVQQGRSRGPHAELPISKPHTIEIKT